MISMNFDSYATLAIFCIIPVLSCFVPFQSDWLIAACFTRVYSMLATLLFALEIKFVLKIESNAWGI